MAGDGILLVRKWSTTAKLLACMSQNILLPQPLLDRIAMGPRTSGVMRYHCMPVRWDVFMDALCISVAAAGEVLAAELCTLGPSQSLTSHTVAVVSAA